MAYKLRLAAEDSRNNVASEPASTPDLLGGLVVKS
jgi:hypothetical protein